jgi:predicted Zn-dependent protease
MFGTGGVGSFASSAESYLSAGSKLFRAASGLTEEQEYYLGRGVAATIFAKYRPYQNATVNQYLNKVAAVLVARSDRPEIFGGYHVQAVQSPEINAMAAPGGFIFITTGFLKRIPNEEALAGVIAHEIAHIVNGHGTAAISQANLTEALVIIGQEQVKSGSNAELAQLTNLFGESINDVATTLMTSGYSRRQEYAADEYAAELLVKAGYNPKGLEQMLLATKSATGEGGWLSTHPSADNRIEELQDEGLLKADGINGEAARTARYRAALSPLRG